jgi:hypothetical protein
MLREAQRHIARYARGRRAPRWEHGLRSVKKEEMNARFAREETTARFCSRKKSSPTGAWSSFREERRNECSLRSRRYECSLRSRKKSSLTGARSSLREEIKASLRSRRNHCSLRSHTHLIHHKIHFNLPCAPKTPFKPILYFPRHFFIFIPYKRESPLGYHFDIGDDA